MSSQSQVDDIETRLNELAKSYESHGKSARDLIDADQVSILSCLRDGVSSVQGLVEGLKNGDKQEDVTISPEDRLTISLNFVWIDKPKIPGAYIADFDLPAAKSGLTSNQRSSAAVTTRERCTQMSTCFTKLAKLADKHLDDVMNVQLATIGIEVELDRLKEDLDQTTESAQRAVTATQDSLESKRTETEGAQRRLASVERDLRGVEDKASENKTHRKIKFGALAAVPFFPPVAIGVAVAGQLGHMVLKDEKQDLVREKNDAAARTRSLQSEIASLEQQSQALESSLAAKETLSSRCDELGRQADLSRRELGCRAAEYQALKEAASAFSLWTGRLQHRAGRMEDLDDDDDEYEDDVKGAVLRLAADLERCERREIREICGPLRRCVEG